MNPLLDLAEQTVFYLDAKQVTAHKREEYRRVRDLFLARNDGIEWKDCVTDPAFQLFTAKAYRELRNARSQQYNAERRMMTRYRRINQGVA